MRKLSIALFAVTTLLLCLVRPVVAQKPVPFKGVFTPVILNGTAVDATHELFIVTVPGKATVLGKFQGSAYFILDTSSFTYVGEYWWPAANGDFIYGSFGGEFLPTGTASIFDNVEQVTVEGGTGKFADATGMFAAGGQLDAATLTAVAPWPFFGTITLP